MTSNKNPVRKNLHHETMVYLMCILLLIVVSVMLVLLRSIHQVESQITQRSAYLPLNIRDEEASRR